MTCLGDVDAVLSTFQTKFLRTDLRLHAQCLLINLIRQCQREVSNLYQLFLRGTDNQEALRRCELEQLGQCQDGQTGIVICLRSRQLTIGHRSFLA